MLSVPSRLRRLVTRPCDPRLAALLLGQPPGDEEPDHADRGAAEQREHDRLAQLDVGVGGVGRRGLAAASRASRWCRPPSWPARSPPGSRRGRPRSLPCRTCSSSRGPGVRTGLSLPYRITRKRRWPPDSSAASVRGVPRRHQPVRRRVGRVVDPHPDGGGGRRAGSAGRPGRPRRRRPPCAPRPRPAPRGSASRCTGMRARPASKTPPTTLDPGRAVRREDEAALSAGEHAGDQERDGRGDRDQQRQQHRGPEHRGDGPPAQRDPQLLDVAAVCRHAGRLGVGVEGHAPNCVTSRGRLRLPGAVDRGCGPPHRVARMREDGVRVQVRRLDPAIPLPAYAHPGDAGADLCTTVDVRLEPGRAGAGPHRDRHRAARRASSRWCTRVPGWPPGAGSRSSTRPGTVDAGYRGEIKVMLINLDPREAVVLRRGDRIAQLVVQRVERARFVEVDELPGVGARRGRARVHRRFRRRSTPGEQRGPRGTTDEDATQVEAGRAGRGGPAGRSRATPPTTSDDGPTAAADGPWDASEVELDEDDRHARHLGSLAVTGRPGVEVRLQADQASGQVQSVMLVAEDGAMELRPFAAPRHESIWDDIRERLAAEATRRGGRGGRGRGPYGTALQMVLPGGRARRARRARRPRPCIGIAGPRWLLRVIDLRAPGRGVPRGRSPRAGRCARSSWCAAPSRWSPGEALPLRPAAECPADAAAGPGPPPS